MLFTRIPCRFIPAVNDDIPAANSGDVLIVTGCDGGWFSNRASLVGLVPDEAGGFAQLAEGQSFCCGFMQEHERFIALHFLLGGSGSEFSNEERPEALPDVAL